MSTTQKAALSVKGRSVSQPTEPTPPTQLTLFDNGPDIERLKRLCEAILETSFSPGTEKRYKSAWKLFDRWCADVGRVSLPASAETCMLWATDRSLAGIKIKTIRTQLCGIAARHLRHGQLSPLNDQLRLLLANLARQKRERTKGKKALTVEHIRKVLAARPGRYSSAWSRNKAIIVAGFALGWRRCELSVLDLSSVTINPRGAVVTLGASKTDQAGTVGRVVAIPRTGGDLCPVAALESWIEVRGAFEGPLFVGMRHGLVTNERLSGDAICSIIQAAIAAIGERPSDYGGHSLRAGMITAAAEAGASDRAIMNRSGHDDPKTLKVYIRPTEGFRIDPLAGVLQ